MIYVAFGFGLWFVLVMSFGAILKWKPHVRLATLLSLPLLALAAFAVLV